MEYVRSKFQEMEIVIRDLEESDVPALVEYWHASSPEYLRSIGVDLAKLTTREETQRRFLASLEAAGRRSRVTLVVAAAGGEPLAYSNADLGADGAGTVHAHVLDPALRRVGFASAVFLSVLRVFCTHFGIEKLVFQTSPENEAINRLVQRFGFAPRRVHLEQPDGMARPGLFNLYEVPREALLRAADRETARTPRAGPPSASG